MFASLMISAAAFTADESSVSHTYIGRLPVADGQARVAVVVTGKDFVAYACGNRAAFAKDFQRWWKGTLGEGPAVVAADGATLELVRTADGFAGEVRGATGMLAFSARPTPKRSLAGLYRGEQTVGDSAYVLGWIVDAEHRVVGGCSCKSTGAKKPVAAVRKLAPPTGKKVSLKPRTKAKPAEEVEEEPAEKKPTPASEEEEGVEAEPDPGDALDAAAEESAEEAVRPAKVKSAAKLPKGAAVKKPVKKIVEPVEDDEPKAAASDEDAEPAKPAPKKPKPAAKKPPNDDDDDDK